MSLLTKLQQLPLTQQLPSYCVGQMRTWLPEICQQQADTYIQWPGRTYRRRLVKAVALCSIHGAMAPSQSNVVASVSCYALSKMTRFSRYTPALYSLLKAAPVPWWHAFGGACMLVGTAPAPSLSPEPPQAAGRTTDPTGAPGNAAADSPENLGAAVLQARMAAQYDWMEVCGTALSGFAAAVSCGLSGLGQMALQTQAQRCAASGQHRLAQACRIGAMGWLIAMEPLRLILQGVPLVIELSLALPCAALGALMGVGVFFYSMHVDPWAEVRDGMAVA